MRAFVSGPTRAKTVVSIDRVAERGVVHARRPASPVSAPSTSRPRSWHTFTATCWLSPVMTFTTMPSSASRASDGAASAFGRSMNTRNPTNSRCCSSASVGVGHAGRGPGADRDHARAGVVERARASSAASRRARASLRASTASGSPFTTSQRVAVGGVGDDRRQPALVVERPRRDSLPLARLGRRRRRRPRPTARRRARCR